MWSSQLQSNTSINTIQWTNQLAMREKFHRLQYQTTSLYSHEYNRGRVYQLSSDNSKHDYISESHSFVNAANNFDVIVLTTMSHLQCYNCPPQLMWRTISDQSTISNTRRKLWQNLKTKYNFMLLHIINTSWYLISNSMYTFTFY